MKKQMTFISYVEDKDGKMIDFERFNCARANTVLNNLKKLYNGAWGSLYNYPNADHVTIYATPDGYNKAGAIIVEPWKNFKEI